MSKSHLTTVSLVLVCSLLLAACQAQPTAQMEAKPSNAGMAPAATTAPSTVAPSLVVAPGSKLANVETGYQSPAAQEKVTFKLVVDANGVITDAQTEVLAQNPASKMRQESFAKSFPEAVKGKKLSELTKIDRVGGSSLTTGAFNKALDQLKASVQM